MHSFEVHSNESACRKSGRLRLEQVQRNCETAWSLLECKMQKEHANILMTLYSDNVIIEDLRMSWNLQWNGLQTKINSLLLFISTNNIIRHDVGTHQGERSSNKIDWEVKVKTWNQWLNKYNYIVLDWVWRITSPMVKIWC